MKPAQVELFRKAREAVLSLDACGAKELRRRYGELFHVDPKSTRALKPAELRAAIALELQERAAAARDL